MDSIRQLGACQLQSITINAAQSNVTDEEVSENNTCSVYHINIPVLAIQALDDPVALTENVRSQEEEFSNARPFSQAYGIPLVFYRPPQASNPR